MRARATLRRPPCLVAVCIFLFSCALALGQEANPLPDTSKPAETQSGANPAYCLAKEQSCTAPEYAFVNFLQKELSAHDFLSFRSDFLNDKKGQRTSYATRYSENTITWCHWIGTTIQIRPELRFERAWDRKSYDFGRRQSELTLATDLIFHF